MKTIQVSVPKLEDVIKPDARAVHMGEKIAVSVLIPCRDGEKTLPVTIESLLNQTIPVHIVVADDHSIDSTSKILNAYQVQSVKYPRRDPKNYDRVSILINMAYMVAPPSDFYMISGDDQFFPPGYVEQIITLMIKDKVHLASGHNQHKVFKITNAPTGAGRIFTARIGKVFMPLPSNNAWDTWMLYTMSSMGLEYKVYPVPKIHMKERRKAPTHGQAAHRLGRPLIFTIVRCFRVAVIKGKPILALSIFLGHLEYKARRVPKMDIAPYIQRKSLLKLGNYIWVIIRWFKGKFGI